VTTTPAKGVRRHLGLLVLGVCTFASFAWILQLGFTDTDALADVAAGRVGSGSEFWGQLSRPLTGGVAGANANFWRPTTMLQFAMLRGFFGWSAWGWQAWDLLLHLGCVGLVYALVVSIDLQHRTRGALLAGAVFAFHPLSVEIVPAVARSIDSLMTLLVLASLYFAGKGQGKWAVFFATLALGAKETAIAALPMVVCWAWLQGHKDLAKKMTLVLVGIVVVYLGLRHQVLNGIGGYYESETLQVRRVRHAIQAGPWELIAPGWSPFLAHMPKDLRFVSGLALIVVFCGWVWRNPRPLNWLSLGLILLPLSLYAVTGTYTRRLLYLPTVGLAFGAVALLEGRFSRWILVGWLFSLLPASPLVHRDKDWAASDDITQAMTFDLQAQFAALPKGTRVWLVDRPLRLDGDPVRKRLWSRGRSLNNGVAGYSIQAWADDVFGPGHVQFKTLGFTEPQHALPTPRVGLTQGVVVVQRPPVGRTKLLHAKKWRRTIEPSRMVLQPLAQVRGDAILVAGAPQSVLLVLP
jgi:hypothetical protein